MAALEEKRTNTELRYDLGLTGELPFLTGRIQSIIFDFGHQNRLDCFPYLFVQGIAVPIHPVLLTVNFKEKQCSEPLNMLKRVAAFDKDHKERPDVVNFLNFSRLDKVFLAATNQELDLRKTYDLKTDPNIVPLVDRLDFPEELSLVTIDMDARPIQYHFWPNRTFPFRPLDGEIVSLGLKSVRLLAMSALDNNSRPVQGELWFKGERVAKTDEGGLIDFSRVTAQVPRPSFQSLSKKQQRDLVDLRKLAGSYLVLERRPNYKDEERFILEAIYLDYRWDDELLITGVEIKQ